MSVAVAGEELSAEGSSPENVGGPFAPASGIARKGQKQAVQSVVSRAHMPELPEVETVARTLRPHVQGCTITGANLLRASSLHPLSLRPEELLGCAITGVGRRGKLLLLDLDPSGAALVDLHKAQDLRLALHLRMTGRLMTYAADTPPGPHTRCIFDLRDAQGQSRRLFFDDVRAFGLLLAATPQTMQQWSFWRELGPEPLELTEAGFSARLDGKNAAIKAVLLDQKVIAGIGNIYADESLFAAGIDPRRKAASLTAAQRSRLLRCLKDVLLLSISQCGSSIRDYRDANGNVGAFQNSFAVYGRSGKSCQACNRILEKTKVAGRATVYCPHCQK